VLYLTFWIPNSFQSLSKIRAGAIFFAALVTSLLSERMRRTFQRTVKEILSGFLHYP
jgi:hypothetical protein